MNDFEMYNPTRILFGKNHYDKLPELIEQNIGDKKNILLLFGGGSIKKFGTYNQIANQLKSFNLVEFGGIEANPEFETCLKAVEICKEKNIDFILAVGGGSVIDAAKFISGATFYKGDPWDVLLRKEDCTFNKALPFGTVLTLPATGSEANSGAVISRSELKEKRTMGGTLFFPKFSICNPEVVFTLPKEQIANGITDSFVHVLEQYLTKKTDNLLQERQAEAILSTLIEIGPELMENQKDYKLAANLMWCSTNALNGSLRSGVVYDWATHMIGHELTALHEIDHARTLAIVLPRLYENQFKYKKEKLAQYGKRVWNLEGDDEEIAKNAIIKTEKFFQSLGIETNIKSYTSEGDKTPAIIKKRMEDRGWDKLGENESITPEDIEKILELSLYPVA